MVLENNKSVINLLQKVRVIDKIFNEHRIGLIKVVEAIVGLVYARWIDGFQDVSNVEDKLASKHSSRLVISVSLID